MKKKKLAREGHSNVGVELLLDGQQEGFFGLKLPAASQFILNIPQDTAVRVTQVSLSDPLSVVPSKMRVTVNLDGDKVVLPFLDSRNQTYQLKCMILLDSSLSNVCFRAEGRGAVDVVGFSLKTVDDVPAELLEGEEEDDDNKPVEMSIEWCTDRPACNTQQQRRRHKKSKEELAPRVNSPDLPAKTKKAAAIPPGEQPQRQNPGTSKRVMPEESASAGAVIAIRTPPRSRKRPRSAEVSGEGDESYMESAAEEVLSGGPFQGGTSTGFISAAVATKPEHGKFKRKQQ